MFDKILIAKVGYDEALLQRFIQNVRLLNGFEYVSRSFMNSSGVNLIDRATNVLASSFGKDESFLRIFAVGCSADEADATICK